MDTRSKAGDINLGTVLARDLMETDLLELPVDTPIEEAVASFEDYHISGAPVVNAAGELVGVITDADIVKAEHVDSKGIRTRSDWGGRGEDEDAASTKSTRDGDAGEVFSREEYSREVLDGDTVGDWMTGRVISVAPGASLGEVCQLMSREGIHRVFVVEGKRPRGVISALDVVRYLAQKA